MKECLAAARKAIADETNSRLYYALPDLQNRLAQLEAEEAEEDASRGAGTDAVTPEQIAEIAARWTNIPVTRLMSTEKEKLLRTKRILASSASPSKATANAIRLS